MADRRRRHAPLGVPAGSDRTRVGRAALAAGCPLPDRSAWIVPARDLLNAYAAWWLDGDGLARLDDAARSRRMAAIGGWDPLDRVPDTERRNLAALHPYLHAALVLLADAPDADSLAAIRRLARSAPAEVPDFEGLDLWLRRRAVLAWVDAAGPCRRRCGRTLGVSATNDAPLSHDCHTSVVSLGTHDPSLHRTPAPHP